MIRKAGYVLLGLGVLVIAWLGVVMIWGDPITGLYTEHKQHELSHRLDTLNQQWEAKISRRSQAAARSAALAAEVRSNALEFQRGLRDGQPIGRIVIPRMHLRMVFVQGTSEEDLAKGPGHYDVASGKNTVLPGMRGVVAIAGHRTTFLQPFRHIDDLQPGDKIYLKLPYGTFRYIVYAHRVVSPSDWTILRPRPFEKLVLSACHPLYSASHRWVVFARLYGEASPA